jgi:hypothetical protein
MQVRYKVLLVNIGLGLALALAWGIGLAKGSSDGKDVMAALGFIALLATPVDLLTGLVLLLFKKKEWAIGFLLSALFFALALGFTYLLVSEK